METLFEIQSNIFDKIQKAQSNFKKSPKARITKAYLETRMENLDELWKEFVENDKKIRSTSKTQDQLADEYFVEDLYSATDELYIDYKSSLKELLSQQCGLHTDKQQSSPSENSDVKLPRIQLPIFTGKYEEWQTFHDMFTSLIHNNKSLTGVQKLHYLKTNLQGDPSHLLQNYAITESNYEEAWQQLIKRYDNKRYNSNVVMKTLFSQKSINSESAVAIRQLLDTTSSCLKSLSTMGIQTQTWDTIIIYLVASKLDTESHKQWETYISNQCDDLPTWQQMVEFLETRFRTLEMVDTSKPWQKQSQLNSKPTSKPKAFHAAVVNDQKSSKIVCVMCEEPHYLYQCKKFGQQTPQKRHDFVQTQQLCFNCLAPNHSVKVCRQSTSCRRCGRKHHSLLHYERNAYQGSTNTNTQSNENTHIKENHTNQQASSASDQMRVVANFAKGNIQIHNVLLATAVVKINSNNGVKYVIRALVDQGSQASFITEETVQLLGLKRTHVDGLVSGLGDGQTKIKYLVSFQVESRHNPNSKIQINAYVLKSLTTLLPSQSLHTPDWLDLEQLTLADPGYMKPGKIDLLLGAEVYSEVLLSGVIKSPQGSLIAQNTILGWILSGRISNESHGNVVNLHVRVEDDLLKQFFEMEDEPDSIKKKLTESEKKCEDIYDATTVRNKEGRYVVDLPFKSDDPECQYGQSKDIAVRKLYSLEKRLSKNPKLYEDYRKVLHEYVELGHMAEVESSDIDNDKAVYLPHHAVVKEDRETTKVRVVFNASSKGTNNVSLNDDLLTGPKLQQDLRHILMRWRRHEICIVSDLVKMYRQVLVNKDHANFQRILWRDHPIEPITHYKLLTLTFGTACAPYLAVKTLQRLAEDEQERWPIASQITKTDFYIDDLMTGCDTESQALQIYEEMSQLMTSGGFTLQKWTSNSKRLLQHIIVDNQSTKESNSVPIKSDNMLKVLGVSWNRDTDNFEYSINLPEHKSSITKRLILSDIARLYDPLGWIAPVVINAKLIIQKLWKADIDWDQEVPGEVLTEWTEYRNELLKVKDILIPRWLGSSQDSKTELHAFSDASQVAYAAAVYCRTVDANNHVHVTLITAKTKVAPIAKQVSIPRLELCGAALAAKLLSEVSQVMGIPKENLYAWTHSTIVLAWLKGSPSRWATFVSNRISTILTILDIDQWGHVATDINPADCASRGLKPEELKTHTLWWSGPAWLQDETIETGEWDVPETHEEERVKAHVVTEQPKEDFLWCQFSDLQRMLRVMSYCRRILMLKTPKANRRLFTELVTIEETDKTLELCIKQVQEFEFGEEIRHLRLHGFVPKKSVLHNLVPILDQNGLLRVGGRITQASVSFEKQHPIIIPEKSHLAKLLVADAHIKTLHGGPQVILNFLRSKYWILRVRSLAKKCFGSCVTCLRFSKVQKTQLMGQLPEVRLRPSKPFRSSGVDYAGPINIRFSPGRGSKSYKGYICVFVCMVSRAIHLEAVTDLTSKGFIAAFRRFTARRGHCYDLYSDNGTNFVGANKELQKMIGKAESELSEELSKLLTLERTRWHYIVPHGPNFGGLWEAGVRCVKSHLKRVVGDSTLTYEELSTVLAQIEACLNSRPLTLLSDHPDDPLPLTPGHFLLGEPLLNIADEDCSDLNLSNLDRWKLVQQMVNRFWKRWSKEYLVNLNQRYKWSVKQSEPNINDVVIIKEDNIPPCKWLLGKIVSLHKGPDNLTRVVTVKCKSDFGFTSINSRRATFRNYSL
ncbi:hypothetical protein ABMA28_010714 [Loxostege sticticalis]|uniref:Integrase catalytic domain-containing protein n=1 Tax=Loxostege sticticalis TaxID=481309 RepID=A0ABD0S9X1_LOXSC